MIILKKIDDGIARLEYGVLVLLMAGLTLILVAQVVFRYFFSSPIFWAEDVAIQLLTLATGIGISYLIYQNDMIKVDFFLTIIPKSTAQMLQKIIFGLSFITMLIVSIYATGWVMRPENHYLISPTTGLPKWYNYAWMIVSFYCMGWHFLAKCISPSPSSDIKEDMPC